METSENPKECVHAENSMERIILQIRTDNFIIDTKKTWLERWHENCLRPA
jgi:hypothetical protein